MIGCITDRLVVDPRYGSWAVIERASALAVGSVLLKAWASRITGMST
jgi:hypothetical protein